MAKSRLDFKNPIVSPEAVGTLSEQGQAAPTDRKKKAGTRRNPDVIRNEDGGNSSQEGLTPENTRFSCICKVENVKRVKDYAYTNRITIRQAIDEIIETFFKDYAGDLLDHNEGKGNK